MTSPGTVDEFELHAYVDGELAGPRHGEISAWLDNHPAEARMVAVWRRQKRAIRDGFAAVADEAVPLPIQALLRRARPIRDWFAPSAAAAALAFLVVGVIAGWVLNDRLGAQSLAQRALVAHEVYAVEVRHPVEVPASEREHLTSWLSKRLGKSLVIPDLAPHGYAFLGGRLLAAEDRPAAQLMFQNEAKKRLTLFLIAGDFGKSEFRIEERGDFLACYWLDGDFGFAIAGELDRQQAVKLAEAVYDQFEKD